MGELQSEIEWLKAARADRGWSAAEVARRVVEVAASHDDRMTLTQQAVSGFEAGSTKSVPRWMRYAREAFQPKAGSVQPHSDNVDIVSIDFEYGMGATYAVEHVEQTIHSFPRRWLEGITPSPPALLTWTRGKGDSMTPTILDGDMILIDRSQTRVEDQDKVWALATTDGLGMIKRVRVRGGKVIAMADNAVLPDDVYDEDEVRIVGRVVFVGRRI